jgi:predicted nucleotide-binding protein
MPARRPPQEQRAANLSPQQKAEAISRLEKRIADLSSFKPSEMNPEGGDSRVTTLEQAIERTLDHIFGTDTVERKRYAGAHHLDRTVMVMMIMDGMPLPDHRSGLEEGKQAAISILTGVIAGFREDLDEFPELAATRHFEPSPSERPSIPTSRKIFVVHGHDDGAREAVARFLYQIGFEPIILHEQANRGGTVIEKVEAHGDVGFAIVLLTPDDQGCKNGSGLQPRARQNVILELGYFLGRLGRSRVCALKRGELEIPSDFGGVIYEQFDNGGGWKQAIGRELQAVGFHIDWNKVMRL